MSTTKCTIINAEGFSLKNRPNKKFNNPTDKKMSIWTFSTKNWNQETNECTGALADCLNELAEAGYQNLTVVLSDMNLEIKQDSKIIDSQVASGIKAPRTKEEAQVIIDQYDDNELFNEVNHKCVGCSKSCKQSNRATIYQCPQYKQAS